MNSKIIIYDDSCPLCSAYTNAFIHTGLITKEGRKNFSSIEPALLAQIDLERVVNEIPLIDPQTKQVWYGIDALTEILQQRIPFIKPILQIKPLEWLLRRLYKFISYNRRVIVAGGNQPGQFDCSPDFNTTYRIALILALLAFNFCMLPPLQQHVFSNSLFDQSTPNNVMVARITLTMANFIPALLLPRNTALEYLGQLSVLTTMVVLLAIPLILLNQWTGPLQNGLNSLLLGMLLLFTIREYTRRMRFIGFTAQYKTIVLYNAAVFTSFIIYLIL